jgi:hypothetical protein
MKKVLIILNLLFLTISFSQEKRKAFTIEIAADETHQYSAEIPESPFFVKEKILQIYCGESLYIECEIDKDSISSMKVVEKNLHPEKTIMIEFTQNSEDRKNITTMLKVKNPFNKKFNYDAYMFTPTSKNWTSTSIIPILPNLMNFETWPHPIVTLILENWRFEE